MNRSFPITLASRFACIGMALFLLTAPGSFAEVSYSPVSGTTPPSMAPGSPAGSYVLSGFETINLFSGKLNFRLPLLNVGGRGEAGYTMYLGMNRNWTINAILDGNGAKMGSYFAVSDLEFNNDFVPGPLALVPGTMIARRSVSGAQICQGSTPSTYLTTLTRLTFTASDGTETEFVDAATGGASSTPPCSVTVVGGTNRGKKWVSRDGSGAIFLLTGNDFYDRASYDSSHESSAISGVMITRAGARYQIDNGRVVSITDRNGNLVSLSYSDSNSLGLTQVVDSAGRSISFPSAGTISYQGAGGATQTIVIATQKLSSALLAMDVDPTYAIKTKTALFGNYGGDNSNDFEPNVVESVTLNNGKKYSFKYNPYGEVAQVSLPTGGQYRYVWDGGVDYNAGTPFVYRYVKQRKVYVDSNTCQGQTGYTQTSDGTTPRFGGAYPLSKITVDHQSCAGVSLKQEIHYFYGRPREADHSEYQDIAHSVWQKGREYKTEETGPDGAPVLRSTTQEWAQRPCEAGEKCLDSGQVDPRVESTKTVLSDSGQVTDTSYLYDRFNNRIDEHVYHFGAGTKGSLVRRRQVEYVTKVGAPPQIDYTSDSYRLISLPSKEQLYDETGEAARTTYHYDCYATACSPNAAELVTRPGILQHDSVKYPTTFKVRGNVTSVERNINNTKSVTTSSQYDVAGNVVAAFDALDQKTGFDFSVNAAECSMPLAAYAFPAKITNPAGQITKLCYDYYIGKVAAMTGPAGDVTQFSYADPLNRLKQVTRAFGKPEKNQTTFGYVDTPGSLSVTTTSDLTTFNDSALKTAQYFDGLGRVTETRTYETASIYSAIKQTFDSMGRAYETSAPFRGTPDNWTRTEYDALDRPVKVTTTADSAIVRHWHKGNKTYTRDQSGKWRLGEADVLGRLTRVTENPVIGEADSLKDGTVTYTNAGPAFETSYAWDGRGGLKSVSQGVQPRSFTYDWLGRLVTASNPESGLTCYGKITDGICAADYDKNGNLLTKTDALLRQVSYTWDALNRPLTKTYPPLTTPAVRWTWDTVRAGSLSSVTSEASATSYVSYDMLGRPTKTTQTMGAQPYDFTYQYNVSGALTYMKYPSGREISMGIDGAGRVNKMRRGSTAVGACSAQVDCYVRDVAYSAHGALSDLTFGNGLIEKTEYDTRLQPLKISAGALLRIDLDYGTAANNGNIVSQTITANSTGLKQVYGYDALNRLSWASEYLSTAVPATPACPDASSQWCQLFGYDRYGNRVIANRSHLGEAVGLEAVGYAATTNRISDAGWLYDNAGNITRDGVGNTYAYDAENRMTAAPGVSYAYDGEGRRVSAISVGKEIRYVYDAFGNLAAEYGKQGDVSRCRTCYLVADHLGSTRLITGEEQQVVARTDFRPFGEEILVGGNSARAAVAGYGSDIGVRQKFTGKERDSETGLDYFGARYFSGAQGRFTSADPKQFSSRTIANPQKWNLYSYVLNNPLALIDPDGLEERRPIRIYLNFEARERNSVNGRVGSGPDYGRIQAAGTRAGVPVEVRSGGYNIKDLVSSFRDSSATVVVGHGLSQTFTSGKFVSEAFNPPGGGQLNSAGAFFVNPNQSVTQLGKPSVTGTACLLTCNSNDSLVQGLNLEPGASAVVNDGGTDGLTRIGTLEAAGAAFVESLIANPGDLSRATANAQRAFDRRANDPRDRGDRLIIRKPEDQR